MNENEEDSSLHLVKPAFCFVASIRLFDPAVLYQTVEMGVEKFGVEPEHFQNKGNA
jgi:hypothetical protein